MANEKTSPSMRFFKRQFDEQTEIVLETETTITAMNGREIITHEKKAEFIEVTVFDIISNQLIKSKKYDL